MPPCREKESGPRPEGEGGTGASAERGGRQVKMNIIL